MVRVVEITLVDLTVKRDNTLVLSDLNVDFKGPGLVQVIGPNGAGKTTLLLAILGFVKPVKGRVLIDDVDVTSKPEMLKGRVGYMPQTSELELNAPFTVWELVDCCYRLYRPWPRLFKRDSKAVRNALLRAGLTEELWHKRVSELSGGERQRVFLARTLVADPPILLLDEPLANIDPQGRALLAEILGRLSEEKLIIVTSHDPLIMVKWTKMILILNKTLYAYGPPEEVLVPEVLSKFYGLGWEWVEKGVHIYDTHR
ncbi:MAG: metal ABC transporter ATP-binding protein [Thermogladius sp.]